MLAVCELVPWKHRITLSDHRKLVCIQVSDEEWWHIIALTRKTTMMVVVLVEGVCFVFDCAAVQMTDDSASSV